ncbi:hypothetical protein C7212DRAFT_366259 [Tuber magnatum]|uniref:Uncharacterized protein n=1 Tax=Tuber magnatum TaxID=42249 RepID=A0A317SEH5_9PEZI|nr:hypothetical protein C7212DRAFT_366259 [Tuber magnatum]
MFKLLIRPQTIARRQVIQHLQRPPVYRRLFAIDSKPEQVDADGKHGSAIKDRLWDRISEHDKPVVDPEKESNDYKIDICKAIRDLSTQVDTGFAKVDTKFAEIGKRFTEIDKRFTEIDKRFTEIDGRFTEIDGRFTETEMRFTKLDAEMETRFARVEVGFAEVKTELACLGAKITVIRWQVGTLISIGLLIFGGVGFALKTVSDRYFPQLADSLESALRGNKNASTGVKDKK